jgi:hypothetical protein
MLQLPAALWQVGQRNNSLLLRALLHGTAAAATAAGC